MPSSSSEIKATLRVIKSEVRTLDANVDEKLKNYKTDNKDAIDNIARSYKSNNLVLVLGAGVSKDFGIPSWNVLLQKILNDTFQRETDNSEKGALVLAEIFTKVFPLSPLIAARYLEEYYENKGDKDFNEAVEEALYENFNLSSDSENFNEIAKLCETSEGSHRLDSVITYNYDNILEKAISSLPKKVSFRTIYKSDQIPESNELPIYHVHGFKPANSNKKSKITLSESIYHQQYRDIYSWDNITQINKFRDKTCLFIGISLTDPNLRRLLDVANIQRGKNNRKYHYIIRKRYDIDKIKNKIKTILDQNQELLNEKREANLELDDTTKHIINIMHNFEEKDALSLGTRTIWIDKYDEISDVIKEIRNKSEHESFA